MIFIQTVNQRGGNNILQLHVINGFKLELGFTLQHYSTGRGQRLSKVS